MRDLGVGLLIISHDLSVLADVCDRVLVMYAGRVVETGTADEVFTDPLHPYTAALVRRLPADRRPGGALRARPGWPATRRTRATLPDGLLVRAALPAGRRRVPRRPSRRWSRSARGRAGGLHPGG